MRTQNYATHRHTPTATIVGFLLFLVSAVSFALRWFHIGGRLTMAVGLGAILLTELVLLLISRGYITRLQDRIIRLEMRLRCQSLLTPAQLATFGQLSMQQIVALRFASDAELPALLERALREQMTNDQIKRAVTNWVPDWDRT